MAKLVETRKFYNDRLNHSLLHQDLHSHFLFDEYSESCNFTILEGNGTFDKGESRKLGRSELLTWMDDSINRSFPHRVEGRE